MFEVFRNLVGYGNLGGTIEDLIKILMRLCNEDFVLEIVFDNREVVVKGVCDIWVVVIAVEVLKCARDEDERKEYGERQNCRDASVWV